MKIYKVVENFFYKGTIFHKEFYYVNKANAILKKKELLKEIKKEFGADFVKEQTTVIIKDIDTID